jgi:hypothetical protein
VGDKRGANRRGVYGVARGPSDVIGSLSDGVVVVAVSASPDAGGAAGAPALPPSAVAAPAAAGWFRNASAN